MKLASFLATLSFPFFAATQLAQAADVWTEPNPGLRHLHRHTAAPTEIHALVIDLTVPGVHIRCTPLSERWKATSDYAREAGLAAAINGGFWRLFDQQAQGLAAGAGSVWGSDDDEYGFFAVTAAGRAWISPPAEVVQPAREQATDAVSGRPLLVDNGHASDELHRFPNADTREPRSAVGVSRDGRKVILLTVDGRRGGSRGATLTEVAALMLELGAYRAINVDGGGSTTMYIATEGGVVNHPTRGWDREVINHIGVVAPSRPAPVAATKHVVKIPPAAVIPAEAAAAPLLAASDSHVEHTRLREYLRSAVGNWLVLDRLHLGHVREIAVPILLLASLAAGMVLAILLVLRIRRNRARRLAAPGAIGSD